MAKYSLRVLPDGTRQVTVTLISPNGRRVAFQSEGKGRKGLRFAGKECADFAASVRAGTISGRVGASKPKGGL